MLVLVLGLASYPSIIPDLDQDITASNVQIQFVIPAFAAEDDDDDGANGGTGATGGTEDDDDDDGANGGTGATGGTEDEEEEEEIELEGVIGTVADGSFTLEVGEDTFTILFNDETEFEGFDELTEDLVGLTVDVDAILVEEELIATEIELETEKEEEENELEVEELEFTEKTAICHIPPGNPNKAHTITVAGPAVDKHLAHGDSVGPCDGHASSPTDIESKFIENQEERKVKLAEKQAEREARLTEKQTNLEERFAEKGAQALQRAEDLIQKLEQRIADLEERLQTLLEKLETGEYYGNVPEIDSVINSYSLSFDGTAFSLFDESVTNDVSGEIFFENLVTTSMVSKFKVTGGDIFVGDDIYDVVFGKARISSTGTSGEKDSMVLILQSIDSEEYENTIRLTIHFDSALEGEFGTEPIGFEISPRSKISGQWSLSATGQLSLL